MLHVGILSFKSVGGLISIALFRFFDFTPFPKSRKQLNLRKFEKKLHFYLILTGLKMRLPSLTSQGVVFRRYLVGCQGVTQLGGLVMVL